MSDLKKKLIMTLPLAGESLVLDWSGAVYVPERRTVIAALCASVFEQGALFGEAEDETPEASSLRTVLGNHDPETLCWIVQGNPDRVPRDLLPSSLNVRVVSSATKPTVATTETIQKLMVGTLPVAETESALGHQGGVCAGGYRDSHSARLVFVHRNGCLALPFLGRGNTALPEGFDSAEILALP